MRVVLLGPPGSGKSTQAAMIAKYYSIPSISAGALLREEIRKGTEIGQKTKEYLDRGELAPNSIVDKLVFERLRQADCKQGFVLDGFPRTLEQTESLGEFLKQAGCLIDKVIHIRAPDTVIITRLSARRVCPKCRAIYNLLYHKPHEGDICYACHSPLRYLDSDILECAACKTPFAQRADDKPEVIRRRLHIQRHALGPVLNYYQNMNLLVSIDATKPPDEVFADILGILGGKQRQAGGI